MRILVVEDDVHLCDVLKRGLSEQGHVVDVVQDGEEGARYAKDSQYDSAIVDLQLPRLDGLSLIRSVRSVGNQTPILILTSRDTAADVIEGLDAGADDYLRKPFVFEELEARLRSITRRRVDGRFDNELHVGDLSFNIATRRAFRGAREINLTRREMAFLEYFMRNAGQVVTRRMLEDVMFDRSSEVTSNVIDVYVSRLRAKIAVAGEQQLLHTIRGLGYRLAAQ